MGGVELSVPETLQICSLVHSLCNGISFDESRIIFVQLKNGAYWRKVCYHWQQFKATVGSSCRWRCI
jgi:hypothetical protein